MRYPHAHDDARLGAPFLARVRGGKRDPGAVHARADSTRTVQEVWLAAGGLRRPQLRVPASLDTVRALTLLVLFLVAACAPPSQAGGEPSPTPDLRSWCSVAPLATPWPNCKYGPVPT